MLLQLQTSMPLCYSLFSTWSVFFWYTFVFVIAARKCHNLWTCICIWVFTIRCWYSLSGWSTEAFFFSLFQVLNFKGSLCFSNRLTPGNTWAQDTKPKACCHLLELAVTVITSNISVKLSHLTTHSWLADDLTISYVSLGFIIELVNLTVRWRCPKRASRFSTV